MLFVDIVGLKNGKHHFEIKSDVGSDFKTKELVNPVSVKGDLIVHSNNIFLDAIASTEMKLKCDLSLEEYTENIEAEIKISIIKRQDSMNIDSENEESENTIVITDEQQKVDISEIVAQELLVKIPMKKVAPKYRGKKIEEIHPSINKSEDKEEGQSPFDVLKKLNNN
ncbi:MAG: YceD family protein [Chlorobiota bacterium]